MLKLFLKTFYCVFLWVLLIVNLLMFFNLSSPFSATGLNTTGLTDSYFGVSNLINVFKYLPETDLAHYADGAMTALNQISGIMTNLFSTGVGDFGKSFVNVVNAPNFLQGFLNTLVLASNFYRMLLRMLASLGLGLVALLAFIAYIILTVLNLLTFIGYALGAMFHSKVPEYPSMDISDFIYQVNNSLTSLQACC